MIAMNQGAGLRESAAISELREALGAVAVGTPALVRLLCDRAGGCWRMTRDGEPGEQQFPDLDRALSAAHLAVVRCSRYCVVVRNHIGTTMTESLDWPLGA